MSILVVHVCLNMICVNEIDPKVKIEWGITLTFGLIFHT